jgi:hypothetical protein
MVCLLAIKTVIRIFQAGNGDLPDSESITPDHPESCNKKGAVAPSL